MNWICTPRAARCCHGQDGCDDGYWILEGIRMHIGFEPPSGDSGAKRDEFVE